jgi:phosphoglycolate phosphatase-like HAD superfamily hydrolase
MLLLFDIDGTLLGKANGAHRDALLAALLAVHGVDLRDARHVLSPAGRTDGEIARTLLLQAGVAARKIDERARDVQEECARVYVKLCPPDLSDRVLPGVAELLGWLSGQPQTKLALVTGNYEAVARLKLSRAGIGRYFAPRQGAFGSDSEDRVDLPPLARRRAGKPGSPYPRRGTIVIGDTPRDIVCAHADGVRCFAVATGPYEGDELGDADAVVRRADELRPLLEKALAGG